MSLLRFISQRHFCYRNVINFTKKSNLVNHSTLDRNAHHVYKSVMEIHLNAANKSLLYPFLKNPTNYILNANHSLYYSTIPSNDEDKKTEKEVRRKASSLELSNCPVLSLPSFLGFLKSILVAYLVIKPTYDHEFSLQSFIKGSLMAAEVVSDKLSHNLVEELKGLVTDTCIDDISNNVANLSMKQRKHLQVNQDNLVMCFPQMIALHQEDDGRVFGKVLMGYHTFHGIKKPDVPYDKKKFVIANFRFVREYTKGVDDDWTIDLINYGYTHELQENTG